MKTVRYTNHPLELSDIDVLRVEAVMRGELDEKWVSIEELESFSDLLYDYIAADRQTVEGSLVLQ